MSERLKLALVGVLVVRSARYPMFLCCILFMYPMQVFCQLRVRFVSAHKINFGTEKMSYTNTKHKSVFVYHKHKKSFGITPLSDQHGG
jgi:hypothetical protein